MVSAGILVTIDDPFFGLAVDPLSEFFFGPTLNKVNHQNLQER